jgi:hypothetical protein
MGGYCITYCLPTLLYLPKPMKLHTRILICAILIASVVIVLSNLTFDEPDRFSQLESALTNETDLCSSLKGGASSISFIKSARAGAATEQDSYCDTYGNCGANIITYCQGSIIHSCFANEYVQQVCQSGTPQDNVSVCGVL